MALGLGVLRLPPDAFWAMTPRELAAAAGTRQPRDAVPAHADFAALMRAHPDD